MKEKTVAVHKGRKLPCSRLYLVDYSSRGFPEWNFITCEHGVRELVEECEERGWVLPEFIPLEVIEVIEIKEE